MAQNTTPNSVAEIATRQASLRLNKLMLLGTFGTTAKPSALVRLPGGKTETLRVGDSVKGGQVIAIDDGRIALNTRGRAEWLEIP
jgi:Tfp pilus assembly protein PilP